MLILAELDIVGSFKETFDSLFGFLPQLVGAIAIFLIGRFIAKAIFRLAARGLQKANIDALVDRSGLGGPLEKAGYADSGVFLAKLVYWLVMIVVIKLAVETLGLTALQDLFDDLAAWLPKLFVAIVLLFATGAIANTVRDIVARSTSSEPWGKLATTVAFAGIWFIGATMALDQVAIANGIVNTLFESVTRALVYVIAIKYGIGGIWAARDRFWPKVYDTFGEATSDD